LVEKLEATEDTGDAIRYCGIVRPIADMGNYVAKHWREVHNVIAEAVEPLGFTLRLVSESDSAGVILGEIVSNLYEDEIVIVDVSGRNPNVMFELGMRLAFEKPAIIVMDDETPFSFDISPVKHIRYPRTLRYADIVKFKAEVANSITATLEAGPEKRNYLQQFGPIKVTELGSQSIELSSVAQDVQEMKRLMVSVLNRTDFSLSESAWNHASYGRVFSEEDLVSTLDLDINRHYRDHFFDEIALLPGVSATEETPRGVRVHIEASSPQDVSDVRNRIRTIARRFRQESN